MSTLDERAANVPESVSARNASATEGPGPGARFRQAREAAAALERPPLKKSSRTVFEVKSPLSGRIRVIEDDRERRLIVAGETLSVYPRNGDWSHVRREYWWQAFAGLTLPARPTVLFVGLGGGTQLHIVKEMRAPRRVTVIERDPIIVDVAREWFGVDGLGRIEFCCGEAADVVPGLVRLGRRFDFVMEDAAYGDDVDGAVELARSLVGLVSPRGTLVLNRHWRRDAASAAEALAPFFREVWSRRVKREGENVLIFCARPVLRKPLVP